MSKLPVSFKIYDYRLPTVTFGTGDLALAKERLLMMVNRKPQTFVDLGVMIVFDEENCAELDKQAAVDFVRSLKMRPVAVSGIALEEGADLPLVTPLLQPETPTKETTEKREEQPPAPTSGDDLVVSSSVRSGQRVYSKGNLIIMGGVSSGAELLANGSIMVFGPLRGRAMAGLQGDKNVRIICNDMQAELVAIAGVYLLGDEINEEHSGKLTTVSLEDELILESVN
jgi:septum site-determining protein MinC